MSLRKREGGIKVGVNYHRPLFKFKQIVIKSLKNLATMKSHLYGLSCNYYNMIPTDVTRLILVASGTISSDGKGRSLAKDYLSPGTLKHSRNNE